jgi:hypothetical protein
MPRRSDTSIDEAARRRLVVVERGASLLAAEVAEDVDETVVLAQLQGETAADFAERALVRIASDTRPSQGYTEAFLLTARDADDATLSARRLIALAIAAHGETNPALQQLVLIAASDTPEHSRCQLLELTDDVVLGEEARPLPVSLRFVAGTPPAKPTFPPSDGPTANATPGVAFPMVARTASPAAWDELEAMRARRKGDHQ